MLHVVSMLLRPVVTTRLNFCLKFPCANSSVVVSFPVTNKCVYLTSLGVWITTCSKPKRRKTSIKVIFKYIALCSFLFPFLNEYDYCFFNPIMSK